MAFIVEGRKAGMQRHDRMISWSGMQPKPHARLFVTTALAEGALIEVSQAHAHYLRNVMRLGEGDAIALFNGRDGEFRARLESFARRAPTATVEQRVRAQEAEPDLW